MTADMVTGIKTASRTPSMIPLIIMAHIFQTAL